MNRTRRIIQQIKLNRTMSTDTASHNTTRPRGSKPIQLYSLGTPNGHKVSIALEELGLEYDAHTIDIRNNEQFQPWFLEISPNNRIPAMIDEQGPNNQSLSLFESGAILIYLAEKTGKLLPKDPAGKYTAIQWVMWQMGGLGPMLGQMGHFHKYAPQGQWSNGEKPTHEMLKYGQKRYLDEAKRLFGVLDKQLSKNEYVVGNEYTIADIVIWPWARAPWEFYGKGEEFDSFSNVKRWLEKIGNRPAVQKGLLVNKI